MNINKIQFLVYVKMATVTNFVNQNACPKHSLSLNSGIWEDGFPKGTHRDATSTGVWTSDLEVKVLLGRGGGNMIRGVETKVTPANSPLIKRSEISHQQMHQGVLHETGTEKPGIPVLTSIGQITCLLWASVFSLIVWVTWSKDLYSSL